MKNYLFQTNNSWTGLILRITLALIVFPHGAQKMLGWFGGYGFQGTMNYFTETVHLPWIVAFMVIVIEFIGSLCLLIGAAVRIWSVLYTILFAGIVLKAHLPFGFFMNWFGNQKGEGYEFHLLIIGISLALLIEGAGKASLDAKWKAV